MIKIEDPWRVVLTTICAVVLIVCLILINGCATVEVSTPDGTLIKTTTLWKDIEAAEAQTEDMILSLGSSNTGEDAASALFLVCTINPGLPICQIEK